MQSANLSGPFRGCLYYALLGLPQATGLAGGYDWERICFDLDLFRGMVEGVFPEVGLGLAGDPFAQEIAQDGTAGTHEHKGQHHHAAPRLRVAEQQKKAEDQQKQADSQEKGKEFFGFHPCLPHSLGPGVASETRTRERGRKGM